ncbi:MAG: DUF362 domain-containing protein [Dehalococcoidia bacterium]
MGSSESSEVFFFPYSRSRGYLKELRVLFSRVADAVSSGDSVAVKTHMGEYGNTGHLRPPIVRRVCDLVKEAGGRPFVTDTTTLYPGRRFTATQHLATAAFNGFTEESLGVPIIIADGEQGYDGVCVDIPGRMTECPFDTVKVARKILDADSMIVLSHVKGHFLAGFGGAIKNLAMGCVTKESKAAQHGATRALMDASLCNGCGECVDVCLYGAMALVNDRVVRDEEKCMSCNRCFFLCRQGVFTLPPQAREKFAVRVAHAAAGVAGRFRSRSAYMNFVQDVTPLCDCVAASGLPVVPDIGILASRDAVAIDRASLDLIAQSKAMSEFAHASYPDILGSLNDADSLEQVRVAQLLGMGTMEYELKEQSRNAG